MRIFPPYTVQVVHSILELAYTTLIWGMQSHQFQCHHCNQDEPSTLNFYVSTSRYNIIERRWHTNIKRQSLLDLTPEQLKQAKNPQDTGVIILCNVCGRRVTHKDGGFWDTSDMLTRKQTIRYKTMQKKFKEQQCNFCGLKLTPYNDTSYNRHYVFFEFCCYIGICLGVNVVYGSLLTEINIPLPILSFEIMIVFRKHKERNK